MRIGHHRPLFCLCAVWMLAAGLGCVLSGFDGHRMLPAGAVCAGLAAEVELPAVCFGLKNLSRRALDTTQTEDRLMAAAPKMGFSCQPSRG